MSVNRKAIVVGAGRLGANMAKKLLQDKYDVVLIDYSQTELQEVEDFSGFMEVGDATDLAFMEENGIQNAGIAVFMTEDDNTNVFMADVCSYIYHVPQIYIRLKDSRKAKIVDPKVKCICPFDLSLESFDKQLEEVGL